MDIKSQYQQLKQQHFAKESKILHTKMKKAKHPFKSAKNQLDFASQLGRQNWRQTVQPPSMTRMQAMKDAGQAFNNNVSLSGKLVIFILGFGLLAFIIIGILFAY